MQIASKLQFVLALTSGFTVSWPGPAAPHPGLPRSPLQERRQPRPVVDIPKGLRLRAPVRHPRPGTSCPTDRAVRVVQLVSAVCGVPVGRGGHVGRRRSARLSQIRFVLCGRRCGCSPAGFLVHHSDIALPPLENKNLPGPSPLGLIDVGFMLQRRAELLN